jgi:molybdopterin converting factor subunit 1
MTILLFAQVRQSAGTGQIRWTLNEPLTADELWARLLRAHPELERHRAYTRLARNGEYVTPDALFHEADEVALIPPVSGG